MLEEYKKIKRKDYYENLSREHFSKYPHIFSEFINDPDAVTEGDALLVSGLARGYNFAKEEDFPLTSRESLIIYNNYIQRCDHFGEVLAEMDKEGLVGLDNFYFGAKATKVFGNWGDEEPIISKVVKFGKEEEMSESVEGCLILKPKSMAEALRMVDFLETKVKRSDDIAFIKGSWTIPDVRSTEKLESALAIVGYKAVYANMLDIGKGNIITLKRSDKIIKDGWENQRILVNKDLYDFID